ncbi:DNA-processing protein DprA [Meridianimarinicoccus aquatilis]|uniref:DNA-protecting protein DprA n=1 Tax=Meridianimarinicoccus aquatilis TaxID=2552766 RepID=A0A4R6B465_9RHOB|nr:DNA-processing protein DprA [Fluviibacterium aquatile]TDL91154.1 DNA-protecting protein DprA [Fluviibacterium aquatile]
MTQTLFSSSITPLIPPKTDEDRSSWLRLFRSRGVGVHTFFRLMGEHGSAAQVLDVLPDLAAKAGVSNYIAASHDTVAAEMRAGRKAGARLLCHGDSDYPQLLAQISDAPPVLWVRGRSELLGKPLVALVGARNASSLGERMAKQLARDLGDAGFVTVSGLARGIDAAVHGATLKTGTIAILGGGIDVPYPAENEPLYRRISDQGLLMSEQPMGLAPQARHFPRRNRIISGLARGLIVVEAAARSGSLITARNALDQGRDVLAVPGHPFDGRATGCNMLIRDGATLVRSAADAIEALGEATEGFTPLSPLPADGTARSASRVHAPTAPKNDKGVESHQVRKAPPGPKPKPKDSAEAQTSAILSRLGPTPLPEDQLIRDLKMPATVVAPALMELELEGRITRHAGGMVSRT